MTTQPRKIRSFQDRTPSRQHTGEFSRTQQSLAGETDINNIMSKYQKTGVIQHLNRYQGQYGEFGDVPAYKEGLERVMAAEEMFMSLPSTIRERFGNDPGKFIAFATEPNNIEELRKMGLAPKAPLEGAVERSPLGGAPSTHQPPQEAPQPPQGQTS